MRCRGLGGLLACGLLVGGASLAPAQGKFGEAAPDSPAGAFTDSGAHSLSNLKVKVVVLYFFEAG